MVRLGILRSDVWIELKWQETCFNHSICENRTSISRRQGLLTLTALLALKGAETGMAQHRN